MCGIVGFSGQQEGQLQAMLKALAHRGPDDAGEYIDNQWSLGHARLSILDLSSAGHQPMVFEHLVIVFNGEVYNFRAIRGELEAKGYHFFSHTDTEVILKAYHCWGIDAVHKFLGMFAFAILDTNTQEITIVRDRVGVKPLYYYHQGESFAFASELRGLMATNLPLELSKQALYEFFLFGYISSGLSIFENVHKLLPGHYLRYKAGKLTTTSYWSIIPSLEAPRFTQSESALTDQLEELLVDAFTLRMVADVPVGVFLSGGIDSSLVSAILQKHHGDIHTFTIGFGEEKYNEAGFAKEVAKTLGTHHTERFLESHEAAAILHKFCDVYDEPFGDSSGIPTVLVSQVAKECGIKVVLSADGGDEIFCGYERYWIAQNLSKKILKTPRFVRKGIASLMKTIGVGAASTILPLKNMEHKFERIVAMLGAENAQEMYELILHNASQSEMKALLGQVYETHEKSFAIGATIAPMQGMMSWDYHRYMVDDILVKVDRATMVNSIEGREPLLDHRIAEFAARLPFDLKYRDGKSKYILRKILERYVPKELFERPKMGFGIPMFEWFSNDLRMLFESHFTQERLSSAPFNGRFILDQMERLKSGKPLNINKLWFALVFEMWRERYQR